MKLLVQWAQQTPGNWFEVASAAWAGLARRASPPPATPLNQVAGWIAALNVQGVEFSDVEHFHVADIVDGVRVTAWRDSVVGQERAHVWDILTLAADPALGGAINTRQSRTIFAQPADQSQFSNSQNTIVKDWTAFSPPTTDVSSGGPPQTIAEKANHRSARSLRGWREWTEGLLPEEVVNGRLRDQRAQGRFSPPTGTITYFQRDTNRASGAHVATHEDALELTTASTVSETSAVLSPTLTLEFIFSTPSNQPNDAAWPTGDYRCQLDVSAAGIGVLYGLGSVSSGGHFARVGSGLASDLETKLDSIADLGTGLKLFNTGSVSWTAGAAGDRFECLVGAQDACDVGATFTLDLNTTDSFADGPWTAPAPPPADPTGLTATAISPSQIDLGWTDNATDETDYRVERESPVGGGFTEIALIAADSTAFSDTTVTSGTQFNYRVRACKAGPVCSGFSNESAATTPTGTMIAKAGTFFSGTGVAGTTISVTGLGGTPKAILFTWNGRNTAGIGRASVRTGRGIAVSPTSRACIIGIATDAVGTTDSSRGHRNDAPVASIDATPVFDGILDIDSFDADGFTMIVDQQFASTLLVNFYALFGDALTNAAIVEFTSATATGNQDIAGVGFQGDAFHIIGGALTTAPPSTTPGSQQSIGWAVSAAKQGVLATFSEDAKNTSNTAAYSIFGVEVAARARDNFMSIDRRGAFVSSLADGFRINWLEVPAGAHIYFALVLRGGDYDMGTFQTRTDTVTDIPITGLPSRPAGAQFHSHQNVESIQDTLQADLTLVIGSFVDELPIVQRSGGASDKDAVATTECASWLEATGVYASSDLAAAPAFAGIMKVNSVEDTGFTARMTQADPSARDGWFITFGPSGFVPPAPAVGQGLVGMTNVTRVSDVA